MTPMFYEFAALVAAEGQPIPAAPLFEASVLVGLLVAIAALFGFGLAASWTLDRTA